jgi:1-hydroxy-2-naphthoate dioxygenase
MAEFDAKLARSNIRGQWKSEVFLAAALDGPRPAGRPMLWRWAEMDALLDEAGRVMPESMAARRSLIFHNPGLPHGTTHTINAGIQMILPGELAWAHRHSIAALRFVIQGDRSLCTVVNGERCAMEDNDLVLTPNWSWHDHHNSANRAGYWLDVLDVGLVLGLNQTFYQLGEEKEQALAEQQSARLRYPWRETEPALRARPLDPHDGQILEYRDASGGSTLPTLACRIQILPPGFVGARRRRTSSAVYFVAAGEARAEIGTDRLDLTARDSLALPNWSWHRLVNPSATKEAILFSVHDAPTLRALGLYREELGE